MSNSWWLAIIAATSVTGTAIKENDVIALAAPKQTQFSLITAKGWVRFSVGSDWKVLQMETKTPTKVGLFQISNQADEGTPDSTNVAIMLYQVDSPAASDAFVATRKKAADGAQSRVEEWDVFKAQGKQDDTTYLVRTAFRDVADVHVAIRLAWPHLSKNSPAYDSEMEQTFRALLSSVTGGLGKYPNRRRSDSSPPIEIVEIRLSILELSSLV